MRALHVTTLSVLVILGAGCAPSAPQTESGIALPGVYDIQSLSEEELHAAIEVAYLDGQINKEEASRARMRLETQ